MFKITAEPSHECKMAIMSVHDAMHVLGGKWKISIITCLLFGPRRYSDMLRDVKGISGKMLSRELKEMETNALINRSVSETPPVSVTYRLTNYGESVKPVIAILASWGEAHRNEVLRKK
ncbi:winged helix-turn-helix transcriptional regulator [Pedobacter mucosus]|uniref:winged helix-turn-helix transcriptional regulator n=1 Tax=Pedobacter mucosus TaxID=2895286 RepID=UPI001EE48AC4|nr:helix-turn-helix domain-containing protein [Pedobacter mucosus]UKT65012.1 helix-turn-helix transcriptional regulator [Pedobacter mucosus]